jgi:hypothetical protein
LVLMPLLSMLRLLMVKGEMCHDFGNIHVCGVRDLWRKQ